MPYTPPAQRSPVASQSHTPPHTEKIQNALVEPTPRPMVNGHAGQDSRPRTQRSTSSQSYLHKHRRSPSLSKQFNPPAQQAVQVDAPRQQPHSNPKASNFNTSGVAAQHNGVKQNGADTPPSSNASGDEGPARSHKLKLNSLEELHAAIRGIEQNRQGSPAPPEERRDNEMARDFSKPYLEAAARLNGEVPPTMQTPLTDSARKITHSRSNTESHAYFDFPREEQYDSPHRSGSDEDLEEDDLQAKPSLIRKKSGELVRPALRGKRRPSSMPGTPTYSKKGVHFQDHSLEHVRTFLQVDKPIAVSTGTSPVDDHDEDDEFPFSEAHDKDRPYDWEMQLRNFPRDTARRQALPVRTEKVYLSPDTRTLCGNVAVRNLSFHKLVIVRFTLDYWKTTSEVVAEYNRDVRQQSVADGCDRFTFEIKLEAHANLENKTMFFCVRYQVGGQEYWDNNDSMNYQVDFAKKFKPDAKRQAGQSASARTGQLRPRSMPSFDDFGKHSAPFNFKSFPQPNSMIGDSPIRLKTRPAADATLPDLPGTKPKNPANQQAFSNRYDFGASLSAAIQNAVPKSSSPQPEAPLGTSSQTAPSAPPAAAHPRPAALTSDKPSLQSPSYHELLDKYCFFGSGKSSPPQSRRGPSDLKSLPTQTDGTDGVSRPAANTGYLADQDSDSSSPSPRPSPPQSPTLAPENLYLSRASKQYSSQRTSRSSSPANGSHMTSRSHSPGFGYPYHQGMQSSFLETPQATVIQG